MTPRLIAFLTAQLFVLLSLFAQNMAVAQVMVGATVTASTFSLAHSVAEPSGVDSDFEPRTLERWALAGEQSGDGQQEHAGTGQDAGSLEWPELAPNSTVPQVRTEPLQHWQALPCRLPAAPVLAGPQRPPQGLASRLPG